MIAVFAYKNQLLFFKPTSFIMHTLASYSWVYYKFPIFIVGKIVCIGPLRGPIPELGVSLYRLTILGLFISAVL